MEANFLAFPTTPFFSDLVFIQISLNSDLVLLQTSGTYSALLHSWIFLVQILGNALEKHTHFFKINKHTFEMMEKLNHKSRCTSRGPPFQHEPGCVMVSVGSGWGQDLKHGWVDVCHCLTTFSTSHRPDHWHVSYGLLLDRAIPISHFL